MSVRGHCLCGAVSFAFEGDAIWCAHCHCESCRRQVSAAFATFVAAPRERFVWTSEPPATYASSSGVTRSFCAVCGTPMAYENDKESPDEVHLYLASVDPRPDSIEPERHDFWSEKVGWVHLDDGLPTK